MPDAEPFVLALLQTLSRPGDSRPVRLEVIDRATDEVGDEVEPPLELGDLRVAHVVTGAAAAKSRTIESTRSRASRASARMRCRKRMELERV